MSKIFYLNGKTGKATLGMKTILLEALFKKK